MRPLHCGHAQAIRPGVQHHFERQERGRPKRSDPRTLALGDQEPHLLFLPGRTPPDEFEHLRRASAHARIRMTQERQKRCRHSSVRGSLECQDSRLLHIPVAVSQCSEQRFEAAFLLQFAQGGGRQPVNLRVVVPQRITEDSQGMGMRRVAQSFGGLVTGSRVLRLELALDQPEHGSAAILLAAPPLSRRNRAVANASFFCL